MSELLPPNATTLEKDIDASLSTSVISVSPVSSMWNPQTCPLALLPFLAWALQTPEWDSAWPEQTQRDAIEQSIIINQQIGSVASIRRVLESTGYGTATIDEDNVADHWAEYRILLTQPITIKQADQVRRILEETAPIRCDLKELNYTGVAHTYDGQIYYDGTYNHGAA